MIKNWSNFLKILLAIFLIVPLIVGPVLTYVAAGFSVSPSSEFHKDVAVAKKDPIICDTLYMSRKTRCYWHVARELQDSSICQRIADMTDSPFSSEGDSNSCYKDIALIKKDINLCDNVINNVKYSYDSKANCRDNIYQKEAADRKNPTICDNISDAPWKEQCKESVQYDIDHPTKKQVATFAPQINLIGWLGR